MSYFKYDYDSNGLARAYKNNMWVLVDKRGNNACEPYDYIEEWGEGYYKVERGSKKNILCPDGSLVLRIWHNSVYRVVKGFFVFTNTICRSKNNPTTRYIHGLANVNGDIVFPMIFDSIEWVDNIECFYAEINQKPYILNLDGSVYDPIKDHLPKKRTIDIAKLKETIISWTLPNLQFFYRDTNAPINVKKLYHIGDIVRAGNFIDVTTNLRKPVHNTRFLIASAHIAFLYTLDYFVKKEPMAAFWNLCTLHFNSYFRVMDVYENSGVTQVLLLHIPPTAAFFFSHISNFMEFVDLNIGNPIPLVDMARQDLDEKMQMEIHPRSIDKEWCKRMEQLVGLDEKYSPVYLLPALEPNDGDEATYSNWVHALAKDQDIDFEYQEEDNFPYKGVNGSVCEGCIFAKTIKGNGEGCDKLFINSFRECYVKGYCEHYKKDIDSLSSYEQREKYLAKVAQEKADKQSNTYALSLIRDFINEILDGDICNMREFDLLKFNHDYDFQGKYTNSVLMRSEILKSIMALVFANAWDGLSVYAINQGTYVVSEINDYQRLLGSRIFDRYLMSLKKFDPPKELADKAMRIAQLSASIGNFMVWPSKAMFNNVKNGLKTRSYFDRFLIALYEGMCGNKCVDNEIESCLKYGKKMLVGYQGENGFKKFVHNLFLDDFLDEYGNPKEVFLCVWPNMKGLDKMTYYKAVEQYCDFLEPFILKRADKIIKHLDNILKTQS